MLMPIKFFLCFIILVTFAQLSFGEKYETVEVNKLNSRNDPPYVITEQRLREIRSEFMYWFFDKGGSDNDGDYQRNIHSSSPQLHKNLDFNLPFFGFSYNYTRISMNGYLEFSDQPDYLEYPLVFPVIDWRPGMNDPSFIGIFYSKTRIGSTRTEDADQRKPGVYYRVESNLQSRTDQFGVELRERLQWDIREGIIGAETFQPKHAIIATWKNMSFAGGIDSALFVTNTFQVIVATDEVFTYAIFNYLDLQWTTHTEAGGDTSNGEGGFPAFVGFNAGNETQAFEYRPYSQTSLIRNLLNTGLTNGFKGRHIFRIDENVMLGSCNDNIDEANFPISVAPESGNMLGGTLVNITGPCLKRTDEIICRFGDEEVKGTVINSNRAICTQPMISIEGYIPLEISVNNNKFQWKGDFFIETPATASEKISFVDSSVFEKKADKIIITWDKQNLTENENIPVQISLWGFREVFSDIQYIDILESNIPNTGEYTIIPANYESRDNSMKTHMKFGVIQINVTDRAVIWSKPIPLGWYFDQQWTNKWETKNWEQAICNNWLQNENGVDFNLADLSECPCTLQQALNDKGRFVPDFECNKDDNPRCQYNRGAIHCVRSGFPSSSNLSRSSYADSSLFSGHEQQCCYDINEKLMLFENTKWASRPFLAHNLGNFPWYGPGRIPTLSQWQWDRVPYIFCCMWQNDFSEGCKAYKFDRRPSQNCEGYEAPIITESFNSPQIRKLAKSSDKIDFTLNGLEEAGIEFGVPKMFENNLQNTTSIILKQRDTPMIEVKVRPSNARWRYKLDVIADNKKIYFDRPSMKYQHFQNVLIYTPPNILNQSHIIMLLRPQFGVEVIEENGRILTNIYRPAV